MNYADTFDLINHAKSEGCLQDGETVRRARKDLVIHMKQLYAWMNLELDINKH